MAWSIVGVGTSVEVTAAAHALTVPAGVAQGDLLVACIASRIASTTSITLPTGGEWTLVSEQKANNVLATGSAVASAMMAYCVRGASNPNLTFTHPAAPAPALGRIVAYRGGATPTASAKDTQGAATTAVSITAVNLAGITTTAADDLIVAMLAGGQEAAWSVFKSANAPSTASGATNTTSAPSTTTWTERADVVTTTGNDTSLGIFDAVKTAAGATGNFTATASVAASHALVVGAFKISGAVSTTIASMPGATGSVGQVTVDAKQTSSTTIASMPGATGSVGQVTVSTPTPVSVTIAAMPGATGSVGEVTVTAKQASSTTIAAMPGATGSVGQVSVTANQAPSITIAAMPGATGSVGTATVSAQQHATADVTGLEAVASVGSVTVTTGVSVPASVSVTGLEATASVGAVTVDTGVVSGDVDVSVTGLQATASVGSVAVVAVDNTPEPEVTPSIRIVAADAEDRVIHASRETRSIDQATDSAIIAASAENSVFDALVENRSVGRDEENNSVNVEV